MERFHEVLDSDIQPKTILENTLRNSLVRNEKKKTGIAIYILKAPAYNEGTIQLGEPTIVTNQSQAHRLASAFCLGRLQRCAGRWCFSSSESRLSLPGRTAAAR